MNEEELYGDAEEDVAPKPPKPSLLISKGLPPAPANKVDPKATVLKPTESTGTISVKERLAMLQASNNGGPIGLNKPSTPKKPLQFPKPPTNNNTTASKPPPVLAKPAPKFTPNAALKPTGIAPKTAPINLNELRRGKNSLKFVQNKRESQLSASDEKEAEVEEHKEIDDFVYTKDKKKFRKLAFVKKPAKPSKPASLDNVSLPIIQYTDVETGVDRRIGVGRGGIESDSFKIASMGEEDELEDTEPKAPALPSTPHPTSAPTLAKRKPLPVPPTVQPVPVVVETPAEETYDEGQIAEDGQELYEEFDEVRPPPRNSDTPNVISAPEPTPATTSPESTRKMTKAEKEKEKKEKQKQEKLAKERDKQRIKEAKEREVFMKKYKISDEETVTSHYIEALKDHSGGKMMLAVKAKEKLQLIRKTGCPDGKWIARNPHTDIIGLVEASNMFDMEESLSNANGTAVADPGIDEEIYEELN